MLGPYKRATTGRNQGSQYRFTSRISTGTLYVHFLIQNKIPQVMCPCFLMKFVLTAVIKRQALNKLICKLLVVTLVIWFYKIVFASEIVNSSDDCNLLFAWIIVPYNPVSIFNVVVMCGIDILIWEKSQLFWPQSGGLLNLLQQLYSSILNFAWHRFNLDAWTENKTSL